MQYRYCYAPAMSPALCIISCDPMLSMCLYSSRKSFRIGLRLSKSKCMLAHATHASLKNRLWSDKDSAVCADSQQCNALNHSVLVAICTGLCTCCMVLEDVATNDVFRVCNDPDLQCNCGVG